MSENAKLKISLKDGDFELSGSELFVTQQIENFKELIIDSLKDQKFDLQNPKADTNSTTLDSKNLLNSSYVNNQHTAKDYPHVFFIDGDQLKIIKRAPGNNNSAKTIATALIYIWAKNSIGVQDVTYPEIRELCREQACLDESNFSAQLKSAKSFLVVEGSGKYQKVKITIPGKERALEIVKELQG